MTSKINKLVPVLRFPEFRDEGEWESKQLAELGDLINGLTYSPNDVRDQGLLVLRSSNIQNGQIDLSDCVFVNPKIKGAALIEPDDILVCVRNGSKALIGKNALIPNGLPSATHGAFMTVFRAINPKFVFQLFQTGEYNTQVNADLGATINSINGKNFLKYKFFVPTNTTEQQKIASCLYSLDEVIAAHTQKLEALKEHKKSLMQNLFPQEGETVPKMRFPDFIKNVDWDTKNLGSVFSSYSGGTPVTGEAQFYGGDIPFIRSAEIDKSSTELFLTDLGLKSSSAKRVTKGDLLIALYGANSGDVAISKINGAINQAILCLRSDYSNSFVFHYLSHKKSWIVSKYIQGGQGNLSGDIVKSIVLQFPSKAEQEKIASFLSAIDDVIGAQNEKIDQLKIHKKGLMQGLFPKCID